MTLTKTINRTLSVYLFQILSLGTCLDEAFCNGKQDGNYKDPDTCFGFIACSGGNINKMPCTGGLMFNKEKNICDYPENTECDVVEVVKGTML